MKKQPTSETIGPAVLTCLKEVPFVRRAKLRCPAAAQPDWLVHAEIDGVKRKR